MPVEADPRIARTLAEETLAEETLAEKSMARRQANARRLAAWGRWLSTPDGPAGAALRLAAHVDDVLALAVPTGAVRSGMAPGRAPLVVSAYLAMRSEIDPVPLLAALAARGLGSALPVVVARGQRLGFRAWKPGDPTITAGFGTREPPPGHPTVEPDLLLVPLLAFDTSGFRLGYGGGYYDRTLQALRASKAVTAIGVAFDEQEVDAVPRLDYDQPIDAVVTPSGLRRFAG